MSKTVHIENIQVPENYPGYPIEIIVREGEAAKPLNTVQPRKREFCGGIDSVLSFVKDRYKIAESIVEKHDYVMVEYCYNPDRPWILLDTDINNPLSTTVRGELIKNPDLKPFEFNKGAVFTNKSFIQVIKENAHCFASIQEANQLIKQLRNFVAKFTTEVEDLNDNQGNTKLKIETKLEAAKSGIPELLNFSAPLFNGGNKVYFTVEVEIEVVMNNGKPEAKFGFFSLELNQMLRDEAERIINMQVEALDQYFTCIRVN
jgi:hypothetical protein